MLRKVLYGLTSTYTRCISNFYCKNVCFPLEAKRCPAKACLLPKSALMGDEDPSFALLLCSRQSMKTLRALCEGLAPPQIRSKLSKRLTFRLHNHKLLKEF